MFHLAVVFHHGNFSGYLLEKSKEVGGRNFCFTIFLRLCVSKSQKLLCLPAKIVKAKVIVNNYSPVKIGFKIVTEKKS
jgi:hypothetical protein